MRVRIIFSLKNKGSFVPFHHQYLLAQLIKGIVMQGGQEQYATYSYYNFSGLKGQTKVSRSGLHFYSSKITLVFSAASNDFLDYFIREVFKYPLIDVGNLQIAPLYVENETMPIADEVSKYVCISPIVLLQPSFNQKEGKRFINPEQDFFSDELYESTIKRIEKQSIFDAERLASFYKFQFVPDADYLKKITDSQKKFARIYPLYDQDVKYEVRGYTLPFTLYAAPEVQTFVYNYGLGLFTHKGFGMLDLANADEVRKTEVYKLDGVDYKELPNTAEQKS